jgi:UDP-GlcNAc3NAcA epimerase
MAEEINRRLLDHMSQVLLCPTPGSATNVRTEHVLADVVADVGDTMLDSLLRYRPKLGACDAAEKLRLAKGDYVFMTLHRAETVDDAGELKRVLESVESLGVPVVFSVHPRTRARLKDFSVSTGHNLRLVDPIPYLETLALVSQSRMVVTDSGGLQKEAYWLGKPTLIARDVTEWREIVDAGAAFLVGTDPSKIERAFKRAGRVPTSAFRRSGRIFGNGGASARVVRVVSKFLTSGKRVRS